MREASRIFVELHMMGANMRVIDCGGGLGEPDAQPVAGERPD